MFARWLTVLTTNEWRDVLHLVVNATSDNIDEIATPFVSDGHHHWIRPTRSVRGITARAIGEALGIHDSPGRRVQGRLQKLRDALLVGHLHSRDESLWLPTTIGRDLLTSGILHARAINSTPRS